MFHCGQRYKLVGALGLFFYPSSCYSMTLGSHRVAIRSLVVGHPCLDTHVCLVMGSCYDFWSPLSFEVLIPAYCFVVLVLTFPPPPMTSKGC